MNWERDKRQEAREQLITALLEGHCWQEVAEGPDVPLKRAMAYRLLRAVRTKGNVALQDGRHGHPSKLRGEARAFLEARCREAPCTPSATLQATLRERFDLQVSVSQINRVRAALGLSNPSKRSSREKKGRIRDLFVIGRVARRSRQPVVVGGCSGNGTAFLSGDGSHPEPLYG